MRVGDEKTSHARNSRISSVYVREGAQNSNVMRDRARANKKRRKSIQHDDDDARVERRVRMGKATPGDVLWPGAHDGTGIFRAELCNDAPKHVDEIEEVHG